jgi:hypothetical protein
LQKLNTVLEMITVTINTPPPPITFYSTTTKKNTPEIADPFCESTVSSRSSELNNKEEEEEDEEEIMSSPLMTHEIYLKLKKNVRKKSKKELEQKRDSISWPSPSDVNFLEKINKILTGEEESVRGTCDFSMSSQNIDISKINSCSKACRGALTKEESAKESNRAIKKTTVPQKVGKKEGGSSAPLLLKDFKIPQRIVELYLDYRSPYNSCLVFHGLGSGKTLLTILVISNYLRNTNRPIIVLVKPRLRANFRQEMKIVSSEVLFGEDLDKDEREKRINSRILLVSYESFANRLKGTGSWNFPIIQKKNFKTGFLQFPFDTRKKDNGDAMQGCLIAMDEVHNIITPKDGGGRSPTEEAASIIYTSLMKTKDTIRVFLTATPYRHHPAEIGLLLNMNKEPGEERFPEAFTQDKTAEGETYQKIDLEKTKQLFIQDYIKTDKNGFQKMKNKEKFKRLATRSGISYFSTNNPTEVAITPKNKIVWVPITAEHHKVVQSQKDADKDKATLKKQLTANLNKNNKPKIIKIAEDINKSRLSGKQFAYSFHNSTIDSVQEELVSRGWKYYTADEIRGGWPDEFDNEINFFNESNRRKAFVILGKGSAEQFREVAILTFFNSEKNKRGEFINLLIGNKSYSEGISLLGIRNIRIAERPMSIALLKQIIGRGIRWCSHKRLVFPTEWTVDSYIYYSYPESISESRKKGGRNIVKRRATTASSLKKNKKNLFKNTRKKISRSLPKTLKKDTVSKKTRNQILKEASIDKFIETDSKKRQQFLYEFDKVLQECSFDCKSNQDCGGRAPRRKNESEGDKSTEINEENIDGGEEVTSDCKTYDIEACRSQPLCAVQEKRLFNKIINKSCGDFYPNMQENDNMISFDTDQQPPYPFSKIKKINNRDLDWLNRLLEKKTEDLIKQRKIVTEMIITFNDMITTTFPLLEENKAILKQGFEKSQTKFKNAWLDPEIIDLCVEISLRYASRSKQEEDLEEKKIDFQIDLSQINQITNGINMNLLEKKFLHYALKFTLNNIVYYFHSSEKKGAELCLSNIKNTDKIKKIIFLQNLIIELSFYMNDHHVFLYKIEASVTSTAHIFRKTSPTITFLYDEEGKHLQISEKSCGDLWESEKYPYPPTKNLRRSHDKNVKTCIDHYDTHKYQTPQEWGPLNNEEEKCTDTTVKKFEKVPCNDDRECSNWLIENCPTQRFGKNPLHCVSKPGVISQTLEDKICLRKR